MDFGQGSRAERVGPNAHFISGCTADINYSLIRIEMKNPGAAELR
jgi:hypothetical protein